MRASGAISLVLIAAILCACGGLGNTGGKSAAVAGVVKGHYPPPTTKWGGRTAAEYGDLAKDASFDTCREACIALHELHEEGIPFLLVAAVSHQGRPMNLCSCLCWCQGRWVQAEDLVLVADFLDQRYADSDGLPMSVRTQALCILRDAGPKARPLLPLIQSFVRHADLKGIAEAAAKDVGR